MIEWVVVAIRTSSFGLGLQANKDSVLVVAIAIVIGIDVAVHVCSCALGCLARLRLEELLDSRQVSRCSKVSVSSSTYNLDAIIVVEFRSRLLR